MRYGSFLCTLLILFTLYPVSATLFSLEGAEIPTDSLLKTLANTTSAQSDSPFPIAFFYTSGCGSCDDARDFLHSFERKHPDITIEYRNLAYNSENRELFSQYKKEFHKENISYPALFIGNIGITGSSDIIHQTQPIVLWYQYKNK